MNNHPIEALMKTAMESIKEMVDVNTVVGEAVQAPDGTVIIPISRVAVGFAAGGGEYQTAGESNGIKADRSGLPFGGGSGAGVSVQPVGFLVVGNNQVRLLPVEGNVIVDRILDLAPQIVSQIQELLKSKADKDSKVIQAKTGIQPLHGGV
jgi:sporulation protein YtfJ